jgi:hypothetical protein
MTNPPDAQPNPPVTARQEVKPSFTWRYIVLTFLAAIIPAALGFGAAWLLEVFKATPKNIDVAVITSPNLAATPSKTGNINNLLVYLDLGSGQKEEIKALFRYNVTVTNKSKFGIDDFPVSFALPTSMTFAGEPTLSSVPQSLLPNIPISRQRHDDHTDIYNVGLLNPNQSLSFVYFAFAKADVASPELSVYVQKKDWIQTSGGQSPGPNTSTLWYNKPVSTFTGSDVLITAVIFVGLLFIALMAAGFYVFFFRQMFQMAWVLLRGNVSRS